VWGANGVACRFDSLPTDVRRFYDGEVKAVKSVVREVQREVNRANGVPNAGGVMGIEAGVVGVVVGFVGLLMM